MKNEKETNPLEVFAGTAIQASMIKSLLENIEIEAFLKDELIGSLNPWHAAPGGAGAVKVFVSSTDYEMAITVIEEYNSNLNNNK